jgi:hypothetical protein
MPANTSVCTAGYSAIADAPTCGAAAASLGRVYRGNETWPSAPAGCYLSYLGDVVLNLHATGAASPLDQPLCAGT